MREILFRAKTPLDCWVYGSLVYHTYKEKYTIKDNISQLDKPIITETIGQFTNVNDKNGKKVFEGDIVKIHRKYLNAGCEEDCLYKVIWHKSWGGWALNNLKPTQCCYISDAKDGEVIGNIFDNTELLGDCL